MRCRRLVASATAMLTFLGHGGAQAAKPAAEVVVAPFIVAADNRETLRSISNSCFEQFVAALTLKGVAVVRDPQLSEKKLQSAAASWAVLGRMSRKQEHFQLELRLLEVNSGEEMRSYFNADKDPQVACRAVEQAADRIAAFVKEHRRSQPDQ